MTDLRGRSIRTLAWLGDVEFEREVRYRLARRGDYPTDRLDAMKTRVVRAEAQARLLAEILPGLRAEELELVRRGRNSSPPAAARGGRRHMQEYRAATALEVLVGMWCLDGEPGRLRLDDVLGGPLDAAITEAVAAAAQRPRRG
jgi:ribonuclease-3 family protein